MERRLTDEELEFFASPGCEATWCRSDVRAMAVEILTRRRQSQAKALTDEELIAVTGFAENDEFLEQHWVATINMLATELRARRAMDLTAEDVEALRFARSVIAGHNPQMHPLGKTALAALDRLLASPEGKGDRDE